MVIRSILVFSLFVSTAFAGDFTVKICKLQANDNGNAYLNPCGGWQSKQPADSCTNKSDGWIYWPISNEAQKSMYSTALSAFIAGKSVVVRISENACLGGYDKTSMIRIQ